MRSIRRATTRGDQGKKRHVLVDTQGLLMRAIVHAADLQDCDGGVLLMGVLFGLHTLLFKALRGQRLPRLDGLGAACAQVNVEIVNKFIVLPER